MSCSSTPTLESVLAEVCPPVPSLVAALKSKKQITIVAIGSSSIKGVGASAPDKTFPAQLKKMLKQRFPDKVISVVNKGVSGDRIDQMVSRFDRDVFALKPDVVILQTGLNDALQGRLSLLKTLLPSALNTLKTAVPVVLLMDIQYLGPYQKPSHLEAQAILREAIKQINVVSIPRFSLMQKLSAVPSSSLEQLLYVDNFHLSDNGYEQVARCTESILSTKKE